jgi:hypothetical protein
MSPSELQAPPYDAESDIIIEPINYPKHQLRGGITRSFLFSRPAFMIRPGCTYYSQSQNCVTRAYTTRFNRLGLTWHRLRRPICVVKEGCVSLVPHVHFYIPCLQIRDYWNQLIPTPRYRVETKIVRHNLPPGPETFEEGYNPADNLAVATSRLILKPIPALAQMMGWKAQKKPNIDWGTVSVLRPQLVSLTSIPMPCGEVWMCEVLVDN